MTTKLEIIMYYSHWPLFSNNIEMAKEYLIKSWHQNPVNNQLLHSGLSLGLSSEVEEWVKENPFRISEIEKDKLLFRIARLRGDKKPYLQIVSEKEMERAYIKYNNALENNKYKLQIILNGGIGDHLQTLSLISWWNDKYNRSLTIETNKLRYKQLKSLISKESLIQLAIKQNKPDERVVTCSPLDLELLILYGEKNIIYKEWLKPLNSSKMNKQDYVFCWRSNGEQDKFSCHTRSVPFEAVYIVYKELFKGKNSIIDITNWQPWERRIFSKLGVTFYDPTQNDVRALIELIKDSRVVSIDTALAHICASAGQEATLLLPMFPDERWQELLLSHNCYGSNLNVIQQTNFGSWQEPIEKLIERITG